MTTFSSRQLIFDCDGVIVDSEIVATRVVLRMLRPLGYVVSEAEHNSAYSGLLEHEILHRIQQEHGVELPSDFQPRLIENIIQALENELQPIPGMPELLRQLPGPIAVASNSLVVHVERSLRIAGVRDLVGDRIFSSEHVPQAKPAPDVYLLALNTLGYEAADTVIVEDRLAGASAALAAGATVIGFTGASHLHAGHDQKLLALGVSAVADSAEELRQLLSN